MSTMPLLKAKLEAKMDEKAQDRNNSLIADGKTRTRLLALKAVKGDFDQLDLDNLDQLNKIKGTLKNTYMESISANKITSGSILGTNLTLAGTETSNNKTTLVMIGDALMRVNDGSSDKLRASNAGLEISDAGNESSDPSQLIGRGIFNIGSHYAGLWPFKNPARRGWNLRADGVGAGGVNGHLRLIATSSAAAGPTNAASWASLETQVDGSGPGAIAGRAGLVARNMLWVVGPARIGGELQTTSNINVSGNGKIAGSFNVDGSYQTTSGVANFGAGIIAQGTLKANGGALVATNGLSVTGGSVGLPAGSITNAMIENGTIGLGSINSAIKSGAQSVDSLRKVGGKWGGVSVSGSPADHGHSVSVKQLPYPVRMELLGARSRIDAYLLLTTAPTRAEIAELWKWVKVFAHLQADDPYQTMEERETEIARDPLKWKERFPGEEITAYRAAHGNGLFGFAA